jgi:hypothetical protein
MSNITTSANSVDSKQDGPDLKLLGLIGLIIPIGAFIAYRTRERPGVIPGDAPGRPIVGGGFAIVNNAQQGIA